MHTVTVVALAALIALAAAGNPDHCAAFTNCQACVESDLCGWCSVPVIYPGNVTGAQCAGFTPHHQTPFVCNGIYSTETCQQGYVCSNGQCNLGAPGTGVPLDVCELTCGAPTPKPSMAPIFKCNKANWTCEQVPPGTPGGASLYVCEQECSNVTTPNPAGPAPTPAPVYACNYTTFTCDPAPAGKGTSKLVCEATCNRNFKGYVCDSYNGTCLEVPPGKGGVPLATCEQECHVSPQPTLPPNPGPPPEYLGVWRGFEIQQNYTIGEWDMSVNVTTVVIDRIRLGKVDQWIGVPYHKANSYALEFWILVTSGPFGVGEYWRSIGDDAGERGPQNEFATIAFGVPGGPAPKSVRSAMTDGTSTVFAMEKCIIDNPFCVFTMAEGQQAPAPRGMKAQSARAQQRMQAQRLPKASAKATPAKKNGQIDDRCMAYGSSCQFCLQHEFCGWCSVDVVYVNGQTGSQCAGFEGNHTQFVCPGRYNTDSCETGYLCNQTSLQCYITQPGDGMPKALCEATCKQTPPPAPIPPQYVCNITTKQCIHCDKAHCPGSMPLGQCETLCAHPHHGPTPDIIGVWRGLYIENNYPTGEVEFVFDQTGVTVYKNGVFYYAGDVISMGADVMYVTITKGAHAGKQYSALYQLAQQEFGMYTQMTFAEGLLNEAFPSNYNVPMYTVGMHELTLAKCLSSPCAFSAP